MNDTTKLQRQLTITIKSLFFRGIGFYTIHFILTYHYKALLRITRTIQPMAMKVKYYK